VAVELGAGEAQVGRGRGQRGARGVDLQLEILRLQRGQHIATLDPRAGVDCAGQDLAADAEAQHAFAARAHLAGIGRMHRVDRRHRVFDHRRARQRFDRGFAGAARQHDGCGRGQERKRDALHGRSLGLRPD
jgi:hypothetical protein